MHMLEEISELIGLQVYTHNGIFLGNVNNLIVDVDDSKVDGLFVSDTNPLLVENSRPISVPYRWIQCIGDVVLLKFFPKRVSMKKTTPTASLISPPATEKE
ncbi:MAG: PRC-barrel domain-containing protein [Thermoplasmata archaeon]|nr:PRC-barrel domain-containing protein [Thermoplasmata archaeon]